jgi:hypothetical protein
MVPPTGDPVARSHMRTVLSSLPETATARPSNLAVASARTGPAWPIRAGPTMWQICHHGVSEEGRAR